MRAVLASPGAKLRWRQTPAPAPAGADSAVVRPIAAATCDIDCPFVLGATQLLLPAHIGHECVAEVLSVGGNVTSVRPGDRVIVPFQINCGACANCRVGRTGNCLSVPPLSAFGMGMLTGHFGGTFAERLAIPYADAMLVGLPDGVDPVAAASVSDNICDAYRHVAPHLGELLRVDPDAQVLVFAALSRRPTFSASVPLYTALIARALGARTVALVDSRAGVRAHAEKLGIEALRPDELKGRPRAALVAHISADPLGRAVAHTAPDGICSSSGGLHRSASLPMLDMFIRQVTIHVGIPHVRALVPDVLRLIAGGSFRPQDVITTLGAFEDAPALLREHVLSGATKTVLVA